MYLKLFKSTSFIILYTFLVQLLSAGQVFCQNIPSDTTVNTSLTTATDTLNQTLALKDSSLITQTDTANIVYDDGDIDGPITYKATDSIVYDLANKKMYLYNGAYMKYTDLELESDEIEFDWTTYTLTSRGKRDSTGAIIEDAKFTENSGTYSADSMQYNFKTKKGRTFAVVTEQDGAFIHSEIVQKNEYNEWYGYKTKFTTCTNIDHPHFYFQARKSKVIPDKVMVTGPVDLVVEGINTPLALPFGIFPTKKGRRSGILMPQYGEQPNYGFFLQNGGYYWAVNDKLALTFLGSVFTRGRFGVSVGADYKKLYKRSGNFQVSYDRLPPDDKFVPNSTATNQYEIIWNHTMDNKARPNLSFQASVNASSNGFNKSRLDNNDKVLTAQTNSNITLRRTFRNKPYNFSIYAGHTQNFSNRNISFTMPSVTFNVTPFNPFERKIQTTKKRFYEKIRFSYSINAKAAVSTTDSTLFKAETLDKIRYGIMQKASVNIPFNIAKFFTFNPYFNYNEKWFFKREDRYFYGDSIMENGRMVYKDYLSNDETGFFAVRNFDLGVDLSTTLTGIYNFKKAKNFKAIRHIMKPRLTYKFNPDFSDERWKFYSSYYNADQNKTYEYDRFSTLNSILSFGGAPNQMNNIVGIEIGNNFEAKFRNKKDSTQLYKKVPLIDQLTFATGYNFTADSLKIQPFTIRASSNILNGLISWNINSTFSPYALHDSLNREINKSYFSTNKRLLRFDRANIALNFNLRGKSKQEKDYKPQQGTVSEQEYVFNNPQLFYDFNIPWSLSIGYNIGLQKGMLGNPDTTNITTNSITLSGHINITPKWQVNLRTGFDVIRKDLTITTVRVERDLHCWLLAFDWTAYPLNRQTYAIELRVKSPLLQELKLTRKKPLGSTGIDNF
ncbi:MAG: hypothetical protein H6578_03940 [Chitinophagales bacterium]|nr:hypothetical protein [Chitinophagales bacterium]